MPYVPLPPGVALITGLPYARYFVRRNITSGDGHTDEVIRIKRWNKVEALKLLAQRFGLLDERAQIEIAGPKLKILLSNRKRIGNGNG